MIFKHQLVLPSPPSLGFRPLLHVPLTGQNDPLHVCRVALGSAQQVLWSGPFTIRCPCGHLHDPNGPNLHSLCQLNQVTILILFQVTQIW